MKPSTAKRKGPETEQHLVDYLRHRYGLTLVERRHLSGVHDRGDIAGWPDVCVEVKSGGRLDLPGWLGELDVETRNAGALAGFVAVRPPGRPYPGDWYSVQPLPQQVRQLLVLGRHGLLGELDP